MRLRRQKEVQKDNEYYYEFLREALPPGVREDAFNFNPQPSPKPCSNGDGDRISSENGGLVNNAPPGTPSAHPLAAGGGVMGGSGVEPLSSSLSNVDLLSSSACSTSLLNGDAASSISSASNGSLIAGLANGKHHNGDLNHSTASKLAAFGKYFYLAHCAQNGFYGNLFPFLFDKTFVKTMFYQRSYLRVDFTKYFLVTVKLLFIDHSACGNYGNSLTHFWQNFRESNGFTR